MKAQYQQAMELFQAKQIPAAEAKFRAILEQDPNEVNSKRMLGVTLAIRGQLDEAEAILDGVIRLAPEFIDAYIDLAQVRVEQKRRGAAIRLMKEALRRSPGMPRAVKLLEELQASREEPKKAGGYSAHWDKDSATLLRRALWLTSNGNPDEASRTFQRVLQVNPGNYLANVGLAGIAQEGGDYLEAERHLKAAERAKPDADSVRRGFIRLYHEMIRTHRENRRATEVESAARRLVQYDAESAVSWSLLGTVLFDQLKTHESLAVFDKVLAIDPEDADAMLHRGHILKSLGRNDEALDSYKSCLKVEPDSGDAWWSLSNLKGFEIQDADIRKLKELLDFDEIEQENKSMLQFTLGRAYENRGELETAFLHYQSGNYIQNGLVINDMPKFRNKCDRAMSVFGAEVFEERASQRTFDVTPIFIVGLPRSGSTLLEQILASHSQVEATKELAQIPNLVSEIEKGQWGGGAYPERIMELDRRDFERMGERYIQETREYYTGSRYFIDKTPINFTFIGLIKLMLPQAIIIDARRNPMDCCSSIYKLHFGQRQAFGYDLENLAEHYKIYIGMMRHWTSVLPGQVHLVHHESVVSDAKLEIRRLLKHCGLEFEENCLSFHETDRAILTASSEQVREPINDRGIGQWRRFESQLEPLKEALGDALDTYR